MTTATIKALIATGFACCMAMPAAAQKHVALVLDNGGTQAVAQPTPSSRIAEGLERLRYRVIFGRHQDQAGMRKYINDFRGQLRDAEVALFYFKGVTLDSSGRNLLMASNATASRPIDQSTIPLDEIADLMTASRANVLLLDAGYSDNTAETLARSDAGISQALAPLTLRERSRFMVAFANTPGKIGRSDAQSPFAEVVASLLGSSALTSTDLVRQLKQDVFDRTRGSQLPWVRSDLGSVQLAALPDSSIPTLPQTPVAPTFDRDTFVRAVQTELKRHQCYSGAIDGDAGPGTNSGLEDIASAGKKAPEIQLASAKLEEFENWLEWSRKLTEPLCEREAAPVSRRRAAPTTSRHRPSRRERFVERRRERQGGSRSSRGELQVRNTGVIGRGKGDFFSPSNPFYSPTR